MTTWQRPGGEHTKRAWSEALPTLVTYLKADTWAWDSTLASEATTCPGGHLVIYTVKISVARV